MNPKEFLEKLGIELKISKASEQIKKVKSPFESL